MGDRGRLPCRMPPRCEGYRGHGVEAPEAGRSTIRMLHERNGHWRLTFTFRGKRHFLSFGRVTREQAEERATESRSLLARVRSGELELPEGMNIVTFLTFGGVVPGDYRRPGEGVEFASQAEAGVERGTGDD